MDIAVLRLQALLAQAHRDETRYLDYRDRYRGGDSGGAFEVESAP